MSPDRTTTPAPPASSAAPATLGPMPAAVLGAGREQPPVPRLRGVLVLVLLAASTFVFVTVENMPIGLLTLMAPSLGTTPAMIGLLVTGYAVVVAIASVPVTRATMHVPRRLLLCGALALFTVGTVATAFAPTFLLLLVARVLTALAHALFWAIVATTAASLFEHALQSRVISLLFAGSSLGTVLGIPAVTWLAQQHGWRPSFLIMSVVALAIFVGLAVLVPGGARSEETVSVGSRPHRRTYFAVLSATGLGVTAYFITQTYVTVFLTEASSLPESRLSHALLAAGATAVVGVAVGGWLAPRFPDVAIALPLAVVGLAMVGAYVMSANTVAVVASFAVVSLAFSALVTAIQVRLLVVATGSTDVASAANGMMFNVGIGLGALLGGQVVRHGDVRTTALVSAVGMAVALTVFLVGRFGGRRDLTGRFVSASSGGR